MADFPKFCSTLFLNTEQKLNTKSIHSAPFVCPKTGIRGYARHRLHKIRQQKIIRYMFGNSISATMFLQEGYKVKSSVTNAVIFSLDPTYFLKRKQ